MQVHRNHMVTPCDGQHIGNQLGCDRCARLVLLVHARIRKTGDHSSDPARRGGLTGRDEDEEFHQVIVDVAAPRLDNEYVLFTDRFGYFDVDLAVGELLGHAWSEGDSKPVDGESAGRGLHGTVMERCSSPLGHGFGELRVTVA